MKSRHYHLLNTYLYAACAVFIISIPLWAEIEEDALGLPFAILMSAICAFISYRHYRRAKLAREEDRAYAPASDAGISEQIKYYKRTLYIALIAFPVLTFIIIMQLNSLESGSVESLILIEPVAYLYTQFGYWTAIMAIPVSGCIVALLLFRKIRLIKSGKSA
jgi:hypothetical protein